MNGKEPLAWTSLHQQGPLWVGSVNILKVPLGVGECHFLACLALWTEEKWK